MSGHSKWSKIKHKKGAKDVKKGNLFTKLAKAITIAANEGGGDPDMNFTLRLAMEKARSANMPSDNIDRAIKKGTGEIQGNQITKISYEAYGPASTAVIIDCTTDNTNRTLSDVKRIVESGGGKMGSTGSVSWQFNEKGLVRVRPATLQKSEKYGVEDKYIPADKDEVTLSLMEVEGVEDVVESTEENEDGKEEIILETLTNRTSFATVDKTIREKGFEVLSSELVKIANDQVTLSESDVKKFESFVENLEENDDVDSVWSNLKNN